MQLHGCGGTCRTQRVDGVRQAVYRIAGRPSDVAVVRYLFAWLSVEIVRLSEREHGRAAKNAFRRGAVFGVLRAMQKAQATEATAAAPQSAALVLVGRHEQAMAWILGAVAGKPGTVRHGTIADGDAYFRGRDAGEGLTGRAALPTGGRLMLGSGR